MNIHRLTITALLSVTLLAACSGNTPASTPIAAAPASAETSAPAADGSTPCKLPQMIVLAEYTGVTGPLQGEMTFTNMSGSTCHIGGVPSLQLVTPGQKDMGVKQAESNVSSSPITLKQGDSVKSAFTWTNWCGDAPKGVIFMVSLPGYTGNLAVPVQDPNGQPRLETPKCETSSDPSTISVETLK